MASITFRCPNTGMSVHAWTDGEETDEHTYVTVTCTACQRVHLVNPKTGRLIGETSD